MIVFRVSAHNVDPRSPEAVVQGQGQQAHLPEARRTGGPEDPAESENRSLLNASTFFKPERCSTLVEGDLEDSCRDAGFPI